MLYEGILFSVYCLESTRYCSDCLSDIVAICIVCLIEAVCYLCTISVALRTQCLCAHVSIHTVINFVLWFTFGLWWLNFYAPSAFDDTALARALLRFTSQSIVMR